MEIKTTRPYSTDEKLICNKYTGFKRVMSYTPNGPVFGIEYKQLDQPEWQVRFCSYDKNLVDKWELENFELVTNDDSYLDSGCVEEVKNKC